MLGLTCVVNMLGLTCVVNIFGTGGVNVLGDGLKHGKLLV